jgi:hypothetical protein
MLTAAGAPAAVSASRPPIGRETGQELARSELSQAIYHPRPALIEQIIDAILRYLDRASGALPGGWWSLSALGVIVVVVVIGVLVMTGFVQAQGRRPKGPLLDAEPLSARDYLESAQRLADAGQFGAAIIVCLRAIAAELDEHGVLTELPGRTADELASEAGRALPAMAAELAAAARLFDDVRYGDRIGTREGYLQLRELNGRIRAARPVAAAARVPAAQDGS